jgi:uncharacterized cupredoxin-like copper-binding protein
MRRIAAVFVLAALATVGLAAGVFAPGGSATPTTSAATVRITVNMFEFRYTLSKRSVPAGSTVIFKVVNKGKIAHDFKIAGKKTKQLAPGKSQLVTVKFAKKGKYTYLCTLPGHASNGMKGVFGVGVAAPPPAATTAPAPPAGTIGSASTTVQVDMFEYRFVLSQPTVPSGHVTFVITNRGQEPHNFSLTSVKVGKILTTGQTETYTVDLPARTYEYVCDVPFHIGFGMTGNLPVTP